MEHYLAYHIFWATKLPIEWYGPVTTYCIYTAFMRNSLLITSSYTTLAGGACNNSYFLANSSCYFTTKNSQNTTDIPEKNKN